VDDIDIELLALTGDHNRKFRELVRAELEAQGRDDAEHFAYHVLSNEEVDRATQTLLRAAVDALDKET
jgi:hypothetical protein